MKNLFPFRKFTSIIVTMSMILSIVSPLAFFPSTTKASTILFTDNFNQSGSSLTNGWDNFLDSSDPTRSDDAWARVGSSGRALRFDGSGSSNPDDGVDRHIATKGYNQLTVEYSRAVNGFETIDGDQFVAQYSLDDGEFITLETLISDQAHQAISFNISNPDRKTKLTLRFFVNANNGNDRAAIDNVVVSGENPPLFYDGFESGDFLVGGWVSGGEISIEHGKINYNSDELDDTEIWTDDNDTSTGHSSSSSHQTNAHGVRFKGDSDTNPGDGIIVKSLNTTGYENIKLRYARRVNNLESGDGDNFRSYYSANGGESWTLIEELGDDNDNEDMKSLMFGPLSGANNNVNFKIKFEINGNHDNDRAFLDDVVIWGDLITLGSITINKTTSGGDGTFEFTGNAGTFSIETENGSGTTTINSLVPGNYTITETPQTGWDTIENNCTVTVTSGNTEICNFTNTKRGSITVYKVIVNPDNNETEDSHVFTVLLNDSNEQEIDQEDSYTYVNLIPGTYTITEQEDEDYDFISFSQDGDEESLGAQLTLSAGESIEITITNKQKKGSLIVNKVVNNNHGLQTSDANDFAFTVNDGDPIQVLAEEGELVGQNTLEVNPGTYIIEEYDNLGYAVGYENCINIIIESNGNATCTITNYDLEPGKGALTIIKNVINNNGGNANQEDFTLQITPQATEENPEPEPITVDSGQVSQLDPNTYIITEIIPLSLQGAYVQTSIACTDNGNALEGNSISLEDGHVYECVVTNDDQPAQLTIVKHTGNEVHNGTFIFTVSGTDSDIEISTESGSGQSTIDLNAGSYDVQEVIPDGWSFSEASCEYSGNGYGEQIENGEEVYLGNGESVTCHFYNTRHTGNLILIKTVIGSEEQSSSWQIHVSQNNVDISGSPQSGQSGEGTLYNNLPTGQYVISESNGPPGYIVTFSGDCNSNGIVTVSENQTASCNITNTKLATLIVKKIIINDNNGNKTAAEFSFKINEESSTAFNIEGQNEFAVTPGTYTVVEVTTEGYSTTYENCNQINLQAGQTQTCTITNNDIAQQTLTSTTGGNNSGGGGTIIPSPALIISEESMQLSQVGSTSITLTWVTNIPSSSYVIYSEEGQPHILDNQQNTGNPPTYGYANATSEIDINPKTTNHTVTIFGLNPNTTYYFRTVSRGSLAISQEYQVNTTAGGNTSNSQPITQSPQSIGSTSEGQLQSTESSVTGNSDTINNLADNESFIETQEPSIQNPSSAQSTAVLNQPASLLGAIRDNIVIWIIILLIAIGTVSWSIYYYRKNNIPS